MQWKTIKKEWNRYEWPLVVLLGVLSLLMGAVGFARYYELNQVKFSLWDCLYASLQLFSIQGNFNYSQHLPWYLQLARFTSPAIAGYTFFQALKELFKEQVLLIQLSGMKDHYIICGLGRRGSLLARELCKEGKSVVIIEQDSTNPQIRTYEEMGAKVILGDARDSMVLSRAKIQRAKHVIAVCDEDSINAEIAEQARVLAQQRKDKGLTCTIHIVDSNLWTLLRERMFREEDTASFRLELFNVYHSGARILLREAMMDIFASAIPPHILIVGMGELAECLIVHAAQAVCLHSNGDGGERRHLRITVIDPDAEDKINTLKLRFPLVEAVCQLNHYSIRHDGIEFQKVDFLNLIQPDTLAYVYVCLENTSSGLKTGLWLLQVLRKRKVKIMVQIEGTGLVTFLKRVRKPGAELADLKAFDLLDRTCKMNVFDDGTHENLARVIHEEYVDRELLKGYQRRDNPSLVKWEDLPEEIRESNLHQANHIGVKLNAIGCGITPWRDLGAEKFEFRPGEIEKMAQLEHERWMWEKRLSGWRQDDNRDDSQKLHPDIIHWDKGLSDEAKEKDREMVRMIPTLLARAGFQIYRLE